MDSDDRLVGRILTRREVMGLLGMAGASVVAGCVSGGTGGAGSEVAPTGTSVGDASAPSDGSATATASAAVTATGAAAPICVVRPAETEGPYFVDERLERSDIRSDPSDGSVKQGVPLALTFRVTQVGGGGCLPLEGVTVDVWHCDALGVYSDVSDPGFNTIGKKFLRGYQVTDNQGMARFTTIYPGWYRGRAVHIHFKIRGTSPSGKGYEFTSQLYFDDALTDQVHARPPYAAKGQRTLRNDGDMIYRDGGDRLLLSLASAGDGYETTFDIGLQIA